MPDPAQIPLFSLMKSRMQMLGDRQRVIAENVANVSTPGYTPRDVDQKEFGRLLAQSAGPSGAGQVRMVATHAAHMTPEPSGSTIAAVKAAPDSETTLDGNSVVVEEQMMKIAETRMDFETMVGLYQKSLGLLRLASRSPTR
jgi:flagellar basal-body rod protein FlgB